MTDARNKPALIVQVRVPPDYLEWADLFLGLCDLPTTEDNVQALLQQDIDRLMTKARRGDDPPCCDPGGGMCSPE